MRTDPQRAIPLLGAMALAVVSLAQPLGCLTEADCASLNSAGIAGQVVVALSGALLEGVTPGASNFNCRSARPEKAYEPQALHGDGETCAAEPGDNECTACIKQRCCDRVLACSSDAACVCVTECRVSGSATCPDCGDSKVFDDARACVRDHCAEQCPNAR